MSAKQVRSKLPDGLNLVYLPVCQAWAITFGSITGPILCGPRPLAGIADWLYDAYSIDACERGQVA